MTKREIFVAQKVAQKVANHNSSNILNIANISPHDVGEIVTNDDKKVAEKVAEKYECEQCDYITVRKCDYDKHLSTDKHKTLKKSQKVVEKVAQKVAQKYECEQCDYITIKKCDYDKHLSTDKHKITPNSQKVAQKYECNQCEYITLRKYDYDKHLTTDKHLINTMSNTNKYECNICGYNTNIKRDYNKHIISLHHINTMMGTPHKIFICDTCDKEYAHRQGLYLHKKKCKLQTHDQKNEIDLLKSIVYNLTEQHKTLINIIPTSVNNTINNTINNANNINIHKMNVNVFLNENCKDAISLKEFVKSIVISLPDLLLTKQEGLVDGINNIIATNLNKLPYNMWPVWCTDKKRRRFFIKDDNLWIEDENQEQTKIAIKQISSTQAKHIKLFTDANPDWMEHDELKDLYLAIVKNVTNPLDDKMVKVVDKLADHVQLNSDTKSEIISK
jgi:hypothetical protein